MDGNVTDARTPITTRADVRTYQLSLPPSLAPCPPPSLPPSLQASLARSLPPPLAHSLARPLARSLALALWLSLLLHASLTLGLAALSIFSRSRERQNTQTSECARLMRGRPLPLREAAAANVLEEDPDSFLLAAPARGCAALREAAAAPQVLLRKPCGPALRPILGGSACRRLPGGLAVGAARGRGRLAVSPTPLPRAPAALPRLPAEDVRGRPGACPPPLPPRAPGPAPAAPASPPRAPPPAGRSRSRALRSAVPSCPSDSSASPAPPPLRACPSDSSASPAPPPLRACRTGRGPPLATYRRGSMPSCRAAAPSATGEPAPARRAEGSTDVARAACRLQHGKNKPSSATRRGSWRSARIAPVFFFVPVYTPASRYISITPASRYISTDIYRYISVRDVSSNQGNMLRSVTLCWLAWVGGCVVAGF